MLVRVPYDSCGGFDENVGNRSGNHHRLPGDLPRIHDGTSLVRIEGRTSSVFLPSFPPFLADHLQLIFIIRTVRSKEVKQMHLLWMIVVGLIVGALAKLVMPGRDPGGVIVTILLGIGGSLVAGLIGRAVGWYREGEPAGFIASVVGAVVILAIYRAIIGRTAGGGGLR